MGTPRKSNRRKTSDYYVVFDSKSGELVGRILDMSVHGMKLMTLEPISVPRRISCAIKLDRPIEGRDSLEFEAESRWCQENERAGWYEAGFQIVHISREDLAVIGRLLQEWVASESERHNDSNGMKKKERRGSPLQYLKDQFGSG